MEGPSRRDPLQLTGKTCTMKRVFLPATNSDGAALKVGDYVSCRISDATATALIAEPLCVTSLQGFVREHGSTVPGRGCRQQSTPVAAYA